MKNTVRLKKCIITALMAAISIVLYVVGPKFPIPALFPSFLSVNFSMVPIFIALMVMGWKSGLSIVLIRFIFGLITGTHTCGIGETADLIIGLFLVGFTVLGKIIFGKKGHYIPAFSFSILGWIIGGFVSNAFALPMYINVMGFTKETFSNMLSSIHPNCTPDNYLFYYFICAILPFNALLSSVVVSITYGVWISLHKYTDVYFGEKSIRNEENIITSQEKN